MSAVTLERAPAAHGADATRAETPARLARLRTFHTLDALRGVAAIVVLLFHAAFFFGLAPPAEGYLAVDLFFVMSGFIIAYRYDDDLRRGLKVGDFLVLRLIRLYPLFLLGAVLGLLPALVAVAAGHADRVHEGLVASFPLALLMLPSRWAFPDLTVAYPLNYVSWSLALEIVVNVAYAATHRAWSIRNLALLVAAAFVGLCVAAFAYGSLNIGFEWANAPGGLPRIVFGFGLGVLIFRLSNGRTSVRVPWWLLVALVPVVLYLDPLRFAPAEFRPVWDLAIVALVVPALVVAAIANEPPKTAQNACALAGVFSYVLYSLHAPFIGLFLRGEERLHLDLDTISPLRSFAFAGCLVGLCVLAHVAWDKPLRRRLGAWRRQASPAERAPLAAER